MKRSKQWVLLAAWTTAGFLASEVGKAQENSERDQKPAGAQIQKAKQQAQKKLSNEQEKIQSLQNAMQELAKKRTELAKSKGKESSEVVALNAKMERIKRQAGELRQAAKTMAASKNKNANVDKVRAEKSEARARLKATEANSQRSKIADEQALIGGGKDKRRAQQPGSQNQARERRIINQNEPPMAQGNSRSIPDGDRLELPRNVFADGPGPVEITRRLHVLEDRLSNIERKLDAILERLGQRESPPNNVRSERGPRPPQGRPDANNRRQINDDRPGDRMPPPSDDAPRSRREAPLELDGNQLQRPQRLGAPPPPGRSDFGPPSRGDGPPPDADNDRSRRPRNPDEIMPPRDNGPPR